ncbi:MAG: hypothetical protein CO021_06080 [Deltaproteobacteria bacterium CG_4_9_14_0_2_um_filter_42_21]|nr:MAG: hypothetical protein CO021_06080 [Deltaproteobacteria bacterium CG_4_9_14_0_2_um_filter_42_21]
MVLVCHTLSKKGRSQKCALAKFTAKYFGVENQYRFIGVQNLIRFSDKLALLVIDGDAKLAEKIKSDKRLNAPRFLKVRYIYF